MYGTVGRERDRKGSISNNVTNWFSSLRRQPKNKSKLQAPHHGGQSKSDWDIARTWQLKDELCEVVNEMEGLDCGEDGKKGNKTKMMSIGRKKFNMDPKKGIEYLIENGLLQQTAESVAQFLYKGEGLNKTAIGDYLGEKNDFNEKVLQAFVALHDFADLILVQALRYIYLHKKQNNLFLVVELLFILILRVYRVKF